MLLALFVIVDKQTNDMLMFPFIWLFDEFGGEKVWLYVHSTLLGHRRGIMILDFLMMMWKKQLWWCDFNK